MASDSEARPLCEITMNHDVGLRVRGYGSLASRPTIYYYI